MSEHAGRTVYRPAWPEGLAERYRRVGYWRDQTFGQLLREWATRSGARTAVVDDRGRLSYAELDRSADHLAAGLRRLGLRQGDRVVVQLPNTADFVVL